MAVPPAPRTATDGGYAWDDLARAHLTPTYAVIGCYRLLGHETAGQGAAGRVHSHPAPGAAQEARTGAPRFRVPADPESPLARRRCHVVPRLVRTWTRPPRYLPQYEQDSNPVFRFALAAFTCRALLGLPLDDLAPEFIAYLDTRRRANGSFNNTPAADGSDGHVTNTWWGLEALATLGRGTEQAAETVAWLRGCQRPDGGFTYQPGATIGGRPERVLHLGRGPCPQAARRRAGRP